MGSGRARRGLIALFFTVLAGQSSAACSLSAIELRNGEALVRFNVEVADSGDERALGLMNRERLAKSSGMLFVYQTPQRAGFWMKNTLIPLDMIFADATGIVTRVHADARPLDKTRIDGGDDVAFVLEINGGLAKRLGIVEGSQLRHPLVDQTAAVWPCNSE